LLLRAYVEAHQLGEIDHGPPPTARAEYAFVLKNETVGALTNKICQARTGGTSALRGLDAAQARFEVARTSNLVM